MSRLTDVIQRLMWGRTRAESIALAEAEAEARAERLSGGSGNLFGSFHEGDVNAIHRMSDWPRRGAQPVPDGTCLLVRDHHTGESLPGFATHLWGMWEARYDTDAIDVSSDGKSWTGPVLPVGRNGA